MTIFLKDIWALSDPQSYKLHFARKDDSGEPLDVWLRSTGEWKGWQEYRPMKDEFNRPYIFALAQFYHEPDVWLFGGIWRVLGRPEGRYEVELTNELAAFEGRLKLRSDYRSRATRVLFEKHYPYLKVSEILAERYSGQRFPGFEAIDLSFGELETTVARSPADWKAALESVKGVYLISDGNTGKRYVGSACGADGIWSRWSHYAATGHGGNVELIALVKAQGIDYCRAHFRFALLEHRPRGIADDIILSREGWWKGVMMARGLHGLNRN